MFLFVDWCAKMFERSTKNKHTTTYKRWKAGESSSLIIVFALVLIHNSLPSLFCKYNINKVSESVSATGNQRPGKEVYPRLECFRNVDHAFACLLVYTTYHYREREVMRVEFM